MYICKIYWPTNHIIIVSALTVAVTVGSRPNFALTDWRSRSLARARTSRRGRNSLLSTPVSKSGVLTKGQHRDRRRESFTENGVRIELQILPEEIIVVNICLHFNVRFFVTV